ncbi:BolA/IbaG family iron-sulfur metabolism protein [Gammaproteobacteria bacterium]|nr:BolA/IbaG family iron-sulfur metabolism protein [Gammaproteobacteria bacterium]
MDIKSIEDELRSAFPDSQIHVSSEGNLLKLSVTALKFENIAKVKRQQMIYAIIDHRIKTGEVHAVSICATSPNETER